MPTNREYHELAKRSAAAIFGTAAFTATTRLFQDNLDEPRNKIDKIMLGIGVFGLAGTAGAAVGQHIQKEYDSYVEGYREIREAIKDMT